MKQIPKHKNLDMGNGAVLEFTHIPDTGRIYIKVHVPPNIEKYEEDDYCYYCERDNTKYYTEARPEVEEEFEFRVEDFISELGL
jgi:hypothetical protein